MTSLYICYQSVLEPLTQTQVVAYLHGLADAGHKILLLTYEPKPLTVAQRIEVTQNLADKGIHEWHWLKYHKRPSLLATLWDMLAGVWCALRLVRQHGVTLIHARSHVPGVIGLWIKKLAGVKLLFDLRGLMAEEYVDAGVWPNDGFLFRMTKRVERVLLRRSDAIVVLTEGVHQELRDQIPPGTALQVIPCCVDCANFLEEKSAPGSLSEYWEGEAPAEPQEGKASMFLAARQEPRPPVPTEKDVSGLLTGGASLMCSQPYMLYVGKLGGWYPTGQMVEFFAAAGEVIPNLRWKILTQHVDKQLLPLLASRGLESHVDIGNVAPQDLPIAIRGALFALCLYDRKLSAVACSPTKVGEYLAAGVPVIANAGVGDLEQLLQGTNGLGKVGVVINGTSPESYRAAVREMVQLRNESGIAERCQSRALEQLDLCSVGWPQYLRVYAELALSLEKGSGTNSQMARRVLRTIGS